MIETTSRKEFEAWAESFGWNIDKTDEGDYRTMSTDAAWGGWLACEQLHETSKDPMDIILNQEALVRDLNVECIVLHKAIAIKNEEIAGLRMALAQAETNIERLYKMLEESYINHLEVVVATDHPDLVGGIIWSKCELEWINEYGKRCCQKTIDCRICQHYCETNGCEMDDCEKGSHFRKSGTLRLWEYVTIKIEGLT